MKSSLLALFSKTVTTLIIVSILAILPTTVSSQKRGNKKVVKSTLKILGPIAEMSETIIRNGWDEKYNLSTDKKQKRLEQLALGYNTSINVGLGGIGSLDATFETVFVSIDVMTAGSSLIYTLPLRFVKKITVEALADEVVDQNLTSLSSGVDRYLSENNISLEDWKQNPDKMRKDLEENIPAFQAAKEKFGDDPKAKEFYTDATINMLKDATIENIREAKRTREQVNQNAGGVEKLNEDVQKNTKKLQDYAKKVEEYQNETKVQIDKLNNKLDVLQADTLKTQKNIDDLREITGKNSQLLGAIGGILYNKGSAKEKQTLLRGGFLKDKMEPAKWKKLEETVNVQVKREEISADLQNIVTKFNQIGKIADDLGIESPELKNALNFANAGNQVFQSLIGVPPNYLGAISAVTGLFKKPGPDRHHELMKFLHEEFAQINEKLDRLIDGQQKILAGLAELSKQMAKYHGEVLDRFDRLDYNIDLVQEQTFNLFYKDLAWCGLTQTRITDKLGSREKANQYSELMTVNSLSVSEFRKCHSFLSLLFYQAFDPSKLNLQPLSLRLARDSNIANQFNLETLKEKEKPYLDKKYGSISIKDFTEQFYVPLAEFVINELEAHKFKKGSGITALQIPSRNIKSLEKKFEAFANSDKEIKYCDTSSLLSEPVLNILCTPNNNGSSPTLRKLPAYTPSTQENLAEERGVSLIKNPIMHDAIENMSEWALFFARVSDIYDFDNNKLFRNIDQIIEADGYDTAGYDLLKGARNVNTASLIQLNMLYGDVTAKLLFEQLWNREKNSFYTEEEIQKDFENSQKEAENAKAALDNAPDGEKEAKEKLLKEARAKRNKLESKGKALDLFKKSNPFLRKNILMLALDTATKSLVDKDGNKIESPIEKIGKNMVYETAIDWMNNAPNSFLPDAQLRNIFGDGLNFDREGHSIELDDDLETRKENAELCKEQAKDVKSDFSLNEEEKRQKYKCFIVPGVTLYGKFIPLPDTNTLMNRDFIYPQRLLNVFALNKQLNVRIADYEAFDWAVAKSDKPNNPDEVKDEILDLFIWVSK